MNVHYSTVYAYMCPVYKNLNDATEWRSFSHNNSQFLWYLVLTLLASVNSILVHCIFLYDTFSYTLKFTVFKVHVSFYSVHTRILLYKYVCSCCKKNCSPDHFLFLVGAGPIAFQSLPIEKHKLLILYPVVELMELIGQI